MGVDQRPSRKSGSISILMRTSVRGGRREFLFDNVENYCFDLNSGKIRFALLREIVDGGEFRVDIFQALWTHLARWNLNEIILDVLGKLRVLLPEVVGHLFQEIDNILRPLCCAASLQNPSRFWPMRETP
jgi:hypothetical protein